MGILESINLPPLSLPIFQSDQVLADGGLLNNIPANALIAKGWNFVIASSAAAKLEKDFIRIPFQWIFDQQRFLLNNSSDNATEHDSRLQYEFRGNAAVRFFSCARRDIL